MDPIAQWYEDKRKAQKLAYEKLEEARKRGAPREELLRLEEAAIDAGDCGD